MAGLRGGEGAPMVKRLHEFGLHMGTKGVEISYRSIIGPDGEKLRELRMGPFRMFVEGSAREFGKQVAKVCLDGVPGGIEAAKKVTEAVFSSNGVGPDDLEEYALGAKAVFEEKE